MEAAITELNGLGWFQIRTALLIARDPRKPVIIGMFRLGQPASDTWIPEYSTTVIWCTRTLANASVLWPSFATRMRE